jgi:hypothetical protein
MITHTPTLEPGQLYPWRRKGNASCFSGRHAESETNNISVHADAAPCRSLAREESVSGSNSALFKQAQRLLFGEKLAAVVSDVHGFHPPKNEAPQLIILEW